MYILHIPVYICIYLLWCPREVYGRMSTFYSYYTYTARAERGTARNGAETDPDTRPLGAAYGAMRRGSQELCSRIESAPRLEHN